jgi:hypothetical protein
MGSRRDLGARGQPQSAHEVGQFTMVLDATVARGGTEQAEARPPVNHVARAPALHVAGDLPQGRDEILDAVRGGEEAAQGRRQLKLEHREDLLQAFAETGPGVGMPVGLEPARQGLELAAGGRHAGSAIRPAQGRADEGVAPLRDEGEQIALLVQLRWMTARVPSTSSSALRTPLPPSITHSSRPSRRSPRVTRSWSNSEQIAAFSVEPRRIRSAGGRRT